MLKNITIYILHTYIYIINHKVALENNYLYLICKKHIQWGAFENENNNNSSQNKCGKTSTWFTNKTSQSYFQKKIN